jgi:cytochrome b pre-mRNA-processing protein 3
MILSLFRKEAFREASEALYAKAVEQARLPVFYEEFGVADTVEGRAELLMLHVFLLLSRLKGDGEGRKLARGVSEVFFERMDDSLREAGVGDLSVGRKIRSIAEGLHGRMSAYGGALENGAAEEALPSALARNVYFSAEAARGAGLARYVREAAARLAAEPLSRFAGGAVEFPGPIP